MKINMKIKSIIIRNVGITIISVINDENYPSLFTSLLHSLCEHQYFVHQITSLIETYIDFTVCSACLTNFAIKERIVRHRASIQNASQNTESILCRDFICKNILSLIMQSTEQLESDSRAHSERLKVKGKHKSYRSERSTRVMGPLLKDSPYNQRRREREKFRKQSSNLLDIQ